jgi:4-methyl-5(b-hydroxyethyl)-thiazole monophosphate biosynthesis
MPRVLVPIAPGFEEIEAITIVDVLRRGEVEVVVAGVTEASVVEGSHGIRIGADVALADVRGEHFDMVVLPGGEPGVTNLAASAVVQDVLSRHLAAGGALGAICAAPRIPAARGDLSGRRATSHPSVESQVRDGGARYDAEQRVVRDDGLVTSRGPGTALEFALEVLCVLGQQEHAERLRSAMLVAPPS